MNEGEISGLLEAAVQMHEIFVTMVEAGFSESQALRIIAYMAIGRGTE